MSNLTRSALKASRIRRFGRFSRVALSLLATASLMGAQAQTYQMKQWVVDLKPTYAASARWAPASVDMGSVQRGQTVQQTVSLFNDGNVTVDFSTLSGTDSGPGSGITADAAQCAAVAPGTSCAVTLSFTPAVGGSYALSNVKPVAAGAAVVQYTNTLSATGASLAGYAQLSGTTLNFGAQQLGVGAVLPLSVTNTGFDTLTFSGIGIATGMTDFGKTDTCASVAIGATCTVNVMFTPSALGARAGTLAFVPNGGDIQTVALSGTGVQGIVSLPLTVWDFGPVATGTPGTAKVLTLQNTGTGPLHLTSTAFSGVNAADFSKTASTCESTALAVNASCTLSVNVTPTAQGSRAATLTFGNSDGLVGNTVALSASGQSAVISLKDSGGAALTTANFANTVVGTSSAAYAVTLTNTGNAALTFSGAGIATSAPFTQTNDCGASVAASASCTVSVTFSPTAGQAYSGTMAITSNASGYAPLSLTGMATAAPAVIKVSAGGGHTVVLKSDGTLWATGQNAYGQFGDGTATSRSTFVQVLTGVSAVSAGGYHTLALKSDGTLWSAGQNTYGQLGNGTTANSSTFAQVLTGVSSVSGGFASTMALKADGTLWATGYNALGGLGMGATTPRSTFVQVLTGVSAVSAGASHTVALKTNGTLWTTGSNTSGQLGDGTLVNRSAFAQVMSGVSAVSAGGYHTMALKSDGTLWSAGYNGEGELGNGTTTALSTFALVMSGVSAVSAGLTHTTALKRDGTLWTTGSNASGQLGNGTLVNRSTFVQVLTGVSAVSAGSSHTMALKSDGALWGAGWNAAGQLGNGTPNSTPVTTFTPSTPF